MTFRLCSKLKEIVFPASLKKLNTNLLMECPALERVVFLKDPGEGIVKTTFSGVGSSASPVTLIVPEGMTIETDSKGRWCYGYFKAPVTLHEYQGCYWYVEDDTLHLLGPIEQNADLSAQPWQSETFTKAVFEEGVKHTGMGTLWNITNVTSVTLPESLETIDMSAFSTSGLTEVTIPKNVTTIDDYSFELSALTKVTFAEDAKLETIGETAFLSVFVKEYHIPASVKTIGIRAFGNNTLLKEVTFAEGSKLETIADSAFAPVNQLTKLSIPASVRACPTLSSPVSLVGAVKKQFQKRKRI